MIDFIGSKIALVKDDILVVILRDDKPDISFPNMWDFPGGKREGAESAVECALRETKEELSIDIDPKTIVWEKIWPGMTDPATTSFFFVANTSQSQIDAIILGNEGQKWELMKIKDFLNNPQAIPALKDRLTGYLDSTRA